MTAISCAKLYKGEDSTCVEGLNQPKVLYRELITTFNSSVGDIGAL